MNTYFFETLYTQGLWLGLILALTAGGIGWMFKLGFNLWDILVGK